MEIDDKIRRAVIRTEILRPPKQSLYTFGTTNIGYYLVTEPTYAEPSKGTETVIREGKVIAERPKIVTPYYLSRLEGFGTEAKQYFDELVRELGASAPGLVYTYKNEPKELNIVSDGWPVVVERLNADIDRRGDRLAAIIKGEDDLWDVSLLKFIYTLTRDSAPDNARQMGGRGMFNTDTSGVPLGARIRLEEQFEQAEKGDLDPGELKKELDRWSLFSEYEDRFFALFNRH